MESDEFRPLCLGSAVSESCQGSEASEHWPGGEGNEGNINSVLVAQMETTETKMETSQRNRFNRRLRC